MAGEIFNKADGTVRLVELDAIQLADPSVVRLQLNHEQVQSLERVGNDLVITMRDGSQVRVGNFYQAGQEASVHDVVLQDSGGQLWLMDPKDSANFRKLADWGDLFDANDDGGGGAALLPLLGGGAGLAILAAAAGGGGGDDRPTTPPRDTTPPAAPIAALVVDSGTPGDKISNQGDVRVTNIESGAKVEYQIGTGPWTVLTGDTFTLPPGTHAVVNVRQTDAAGNVSPVTNIGPIIIDNVPPVAVAGALVADTGVSAGDKITSNGAVTVTGAEQGARVEYQIGTGAWTAVTGTGFTLPAGVHNVVNIRQTDVAGNVGPITNIGPITVDITVPAAPVGTLVQDTGASGSDKVTKNGAVTVTGGEPGAVVEYQIGTGAWTTVVGGTFTVPEGVHPVVNLRQTDVAGNVSPVNNIGPITVDNVPPDAVTAALVDDTGASESDKLTNDGTVQVDGAETGATVEYQIDGGAWTVAPNGLFVLPEGLSTVVNVRQTDLAGNVGPATNIGPITVDTDEPLPITAELEEDTGDFDDDGITSNPTVIVGGADPDSTIEYSTDGGETWDEAELDEDGNFDLPEGVHEEVLVRQVDEAGNPSEPVSLGPITIDTQLPGEVTAALETDTGFDPNDGISKEGKVLVTVSEPDAKVEYQVNGGEWTVVEDGEFTLPEGTHDVVNVRQTDVAGNVGPVVNIGPITVDNAAPAQPTAVLADDTGDNDTDKITQNGEILVTPAEVGNQLEYQIGNDGPWTTIVDGSFTLTEGIYAIVNVRETDAAGNSTTPVNIGPIRVDITEPAALGGSLFEDTGLSGDDGITQNGTILVDEPEPGAIVEYQVDGGEWTVVEDGQFVLPEGTSTVVNIRQTDLAGNVGPTTNIGPITVDNVVPGPITGELEEDTGFDDEDGITSNPVVIVGGAAPGSTIEYSTDGGDTWEEVVLDEDSSFELPEGEHEEVIIRPVDDAGNIGEEFSLGPITVDVTPPAAVSAELDDDTGSSDSDKITQDGAVTITGGEPDATLQYQIGGGEWMDAIGGQFTVPEGVHAVVNVRQVDEAGNEGIATNIGPITVDKVPPDAPVIELAVDDGDDPADGITTSGKINVSDLEDGATVYVSLNGGPAVLTPIFAGGFVLEPGEYESIEVYQVDLAGNESALATLEGIEIVVPEGLVAVDDEFVLAIGGYVTTVTGPVATIDVDIIELANSVNVFETGQKVNVGANQSGSLFVSVSQSALVAFSPGFIIELYDSGGNLLSQSLTSDSELVGSALNLEILGIVGDDTLTTSFNDLLPGDYYVVVRNDESTISNLVDNLSLADIGQGDELLGANNREFILEALRDALEAENYGAIEFVLSGVELALFTLSGTPLTQVVDALVDILNTLGVTTLADALVDAVVEAFVANALSLLQTTTVETTLVSYDFVQETVEGDIFDNNGFGADANIDGAEVVSIARPADAASEIAIVSGDSETITGDHGILSIHSDGSFSYHSFGHPSSVGQSDVFVYTISNGTETSEATLTIHISGAPVATDLIEAVDDQAVLDMGQITVTTGAPQTVIGVDVLEVGPLAFNPVDAGVLVTVDSDHTGALEIIVTQTALLAVADAFRLDIYDADGRVVYSAVTQSSLLGDVVGLDILGVIGDDGLVAQVEGLPPGDYYVVVSNDSSTLNNIVQGLELSDLGEEGLLLGPDNQAIIVNALDNALGGNPVSGLVSGIVGEVLTLGQGLPLVRVLADITNALSSALIPTALIDAVIDAISDALISNVATLLQTTTITTTLTEYDFADESVGGNVLTGDGADDVGLGAVVRSVTNSDGQTQKVVSGQLTQIVGKYGVLSIEADGEWTYASFGNPLSIGQTEEFEYSIGLLGALDTAKLSIAITGEPMVINEDSAVAEVEWENVENTNFFNFSQSEVGVLFPIDKETPTFTVTENMDLVGSIYVQQNIAAIAGGSIKLQVLNGTTWVDVEGYQESFDSTLAIGATLARLEFGTGPDLSPGTYKFVYRVGGVASIVTIVADLDIIMLDDYQFAEPPVAISGELFDNDILGTFFPSLAVKSESDDDFTDIDTPMKVIEGDFGDLTIFADGSYSYLIRAGIEYSSEARDDVFDYKVTHPSDVSAESQLVITIEPSGAGIMSGFRAFVDDDSDAMSLSSLLDDYLGPQEPPAADNDTTPAEYQPPLDPTLQDPALDDQNYYSAF